MCIHFCLSHSMSSYFPYTGCPLAATAKCTLNKLTAQANTYWNHANEIQAHCRLHIIQKVIVLNIIKFQWHFAFYTFWMHLAADIHLSIHTRTCTRKIDYCLIEHECGWWNAKSYGSQPNTQAHSANKCVIKSSSKMGIHNENCSALLWIWVPLHGGATAASYPMHVIWFEFVIDSIVYVIIKSALHWWGHFFLSRMHGSIGAQQFLLLIGEKIQFSYNQQTILYIVSFICIKFISK